LFSQFYRRRLYHQPSDQDGDQKQVFEQPNLEDLFAEGEEEEEFDNDNDMAEERSITPSVMNYVRPTWASLLQAVWHSAHRSLLLKDGRGDR